MTESVYTVLVTHRRPDELTKSLHTLTTQSRTPDHIV
ncbi:MAG TPA: galactofuranosyl transferase, partial [Mycobacterium sp.]|nr:galactofuranosyl transferase [Mycobacterium sp.]